MRKYFLIAAVILFNSLKCFSQAEVSIGCPDEWGAGRYNKVTVSVTFKTGGFARLTQEYPVGFDVAGVVTPGCDLSWNDSQLNVVFMDVAPGKSVEFSYYIKPESNMYGPFNIQGEVVIISGGTDRYRVKLAEKTIVIGGTNGLLPEEMKDKTIQEVTVSPARTIMPEAVIPSSKAVFRVQVSASSKSIPESRLRKELGLGKEIKIYAIKSKGVYKYQAGEFSEYNGAVKLLQNLKEKGVKGAFIVAFIGGEQVDVEKARKAK